MSMGGPLPPYKKAPGGEAAARSGGRRHRSNTRNGVNMVATPRRTPGAHAAASQHSQLQQPAGTASALLRSRFRGGRFQVLPEPTVLRARRCLYSPWEGLRLQREINTPTVTVIASKARYGHPTLKYARYGH